jgi:hypothetical protein
MGLHHFFVPLLGVGAVFIVTAVEMNNAWEAKNPR